jgi:hypothetical protein
MQEVINLPSETKEEIDSSKVTYNPNFGQPGRIYNANRQYIQVWDHDRTIPDVYCGKMNFFVPLYKDYKILPNNIDLWTKIEVVDGPFAGLTGYYRVMRGPDLN